MPNTIKKGLFLFFCFLALAVAIRIVKPLMDDRQQKDTSDSRNIQGSIAVALDNWIGYFPLRSPEMTRNLRKDGWRLDIHDDNADYGARMQQLADGKIDMAVATVDSYILNAHTHNYPGAIVMVIDESKGGDAIVAREDVIQNLDDLKKDGIKIAYTPNSPSHHLLKAVATHFNIPSLFSNTTQRIETQGSPEALKALTGGRVDTAVLWEPDVSRALAQPGIKKILGTDETANLIVDILLVNREFIQNEPDAINRLISNYFKTLKFYRDNPKQLQKDVREETKLSEDAVESMLNGVRWISLIENCEEWFGIGSKGLFTDERIIDAIDSTISILIDHKDFTQNPLPERDPYRLTYNGFLEHAYKIQLSGFLADSSGGSDRDSLSHSFTELSPDRWETLQNVGTLKIEPIVFQSGTAQLSLQGKRALDTLAEHLKHYPTFRIFTQGHTSTDGDPAVNLELSQKRAESVVRYLNVTYNIDLNRMHAVGCGGTKPLPRKPGESLRAYKYRLPRVEINLVREIY